MAGSQGPLTRPLRQTHGGSDREHPYDYGKFERGIPEGYGTGIVVPLNQRTWYPEVDDIDESLGQGGLKFALDDYMLKKSWVLVSTHNRTDLAPSQRGRNWLLIKHRDFWSDPIDITTLAPLSVTSEDDFDDILGGDMPDVWMKGRLSTARHETTGKLLRDIIEKTARKILARETTASTRSPTSKRTPTKKTARRRRPVRKTKKME